MPHVETNLENLQVPTLKAAENVGNHSEMAVVHLDTLYRSRVLWRSRRFLLDGLQRGSIARFEDAARHRDMA